MDLNLHSNHLAEKPCKSCGEKLPHTSFYKTRYNSTGLSTYCISCTSLKGKEHRQNNLEHYRAYDNLRDKTKERQSSKKHRNRKHKEKFPERVKARNDLNKAIIKGLVIKGEDCKCCGFNSKNLHGHHYDYSKPLEVIWLCNECHEVIHHVR